MRRLVGLLEWVRPSDLGAFSYEVADTKLKRSVHPKHVLQLVLYSELQRKQLKAPQIALAGNEL